MKQKVFSFGDKFAIRDENGADAFYVDGRVFSIGHKLSFEDANGSELLFIKQKLLALGSTYEIYKGDTHVATVKKELFTMFHCTFHVHIDGVGELVAEGNLTDHEYDFNRNGQTVAQISKKWFSWSDTYGVDIADGEDAVLILASTVVIDLACHGDRN
jgi:uncharacterized protein YxjI